MNPERIDDQADEDKARPTDPPEPERGDEDVDPPRPTYRERRERRAERRRSWAEGRTTKADAAAEAARGATAGIPFGQPILVGHHSQRRHERALERADDKTRKAVEHSRMAAHHEQAADTIQSQLDASIYDDDPDAIERLRRRIEEREAKRDAMKEANSVYRKAHRAELRAMTPYQRNQAVPHPGWEVSNLGANINRDRKRLARLEKRGD